MAAILRVKRKKDEEPLDALLISCKRAKVEDEAEATEEPLTAIVRFAGTVEKPDECVVKHISKSLSKDYLKANYKQHIIDFAKKREKLKQESSESRYKIVNTKRSIDASLAQQLDEDVVDIIDVEDTKTIVDKDSDGYVYDLYYTQTKNDIQVENLLSVLPIEQEELVFDERYREEDEHNSSDSNSESNWRNDYPDSDDFVDEDNSIGENDIRNALKNMDIEDDLSSDDEDFAYGLDEQDVELYGYKYAKFKARLKLEEENENGKSKSDIDSDKKDSDEESSDYDEYGEPSDND